MRSYSKRRGHLTEVGVVRRTGPIRPHEARLIEAVEEWMRVEIAERSRVPEHTIVVHFDGADVEVITRRAPPAEGDERDPTVVRFENLELE